MIVASVYGRLGSDPVERQTNSGKTMVTGSVAVNAGRKETEQETVWISLAAFGRSANDLARHRKGDLLGAMGRLHKTRYAGREGQERTGWSLTVDAIVSARSVRPSGGRKRHQPEEGASVNDDHHDAVRTDDGAPFDDPLPF